MTDIVINVTVSDPEPTVINVEVDDLVEEVIVVEVSDPTGPPGPPGPPGDAASGSLFHQQSAANMVWTINHDLGFRPNVTCFESDGVQIVGDIFHIDENSLTISYSVLVSGYAVLS